MRNTTGHQQDANNQPDADTRCHVHSWGIFHSHNFGTLAPFPPHYLRTSAPFTLITLESFINITLTHWHLLYLLPWHIGQVGIFHPYYLSTLAHWHIGTFHPYYLGEAQPVMSLSSLFPTWFIDLFFVQCSSIIYIHN